MVTEQRSGVEVEAAIARDLTHAGLNVEVEPTIGDLRPDLVVEAGNQRYVIETKIRRQGGTASFTDVAQVAAYAKAVGVGTIPIMVTNLTASEDVQQLSARLGVKLLVLHGDSADFSSGILAIIGAAKSRGDEKPDGLAPSGR